MRIANLTRSPLGSTQANAISVMKTCQALTDEGHDVVLVARADREPTGRSNGGSGLLEFYGVEGGFDIVLLSQSHVGGIRGLRYGFEAARRLAKLGRFDLVFGRDIHSLSFVRTDGVTPILYEADVPTRVFPADVPHRYVYRRRSFRGVMTKSEALRSRYLASYPSLGEKVVILRDGADEARDVIAPPAGWSGRPNALQAGYIGSIRPGKGIELIVELAGRVPAVDFHIVGGAGAGRPIDVDLSVVPPNLHLHGFVAPGVVSAYLGALDFFLVTQQKRVTLGGRTDWGPWLFPMKVFDGMSHGLAICASDVPVVREVLEDDRNAVLVPPDDIDAWSAAIDGLARDAVRRARLGREARKQFESAYTWRHRARRIVAAATGVDEGVL